MSSTCSQTRSSIDLGVSQVHSSLQRLQADLSPRIHPARLQHSPSLPNIWFVISLFGILPLPDSVLIGFPLTRAPYLARWQRTSLMIFPVLRLHLYLCEMILLLRHLAPSSVLFISNMIHLLENRLLCRKLMRDEERNVTSLTLCSLPHLLRLRASEQQAAEIPLPARESSRVATRKMSYLKKKSVIQTLIQPASYWLVQP